MNEEAGTNGMDNAASATGATSIPVAATAPHLPTSASEVGRGSPFQATENNVFAAPAADSPSTEPAEPQHCGMCNMTLVDGPSFKAHIAGPAHRSMLRALTDDRLNDDEATDSVRTHAYAMLTRAPPPFHMVCSAADCVSGCAAYL